MKREHGVAELRKAMGECRWHFTNVAIFSVFVNLLMLTGPLFMLQTYTLSLHDALPINRKSVV